MNNPFDYSPSDEMVLEQQRLTEQIESICSRDAMFADETGKGKMFGILRTRQEILYAFSGQICGSFSYPGFVPAVFDYLEPKGYFKQEEARIVDINVEIESLKSSGSFSEAKKMLDASREQAEREIKEFKQQALEEKSRNKDNISLSQFLNAELHRKKLLWRERIAQAQGRVDEYESRIRELKFKRQHMSEKLQDWLFSQYNLTNYRGETIKLINIPSSEGGWGGSGLGDCCEPKLLNYAYAHHLDPIEMGMFWWGKSPKGEIRHHLQWYPACQGRCKLILPWMLPPEVKGEKPKVKNPDLLFSDDYIIVINKPSGLLSVPGKLSLPSVLSLLQKDYGEVYSVHRLDMDTSGVMVYARNREIHKNLQRQFAEHSIVKCYHALLERSVSGEGRIELPLGHDYMDRPRQMVDYEHGKHSVTLWKALGDNLVELTPLTGRTHQLRVHCAHKDGLNNPIKGDRLYGSEKINSRLMLDAFSLEFTHPVGGMRMRFESKNL